MMLIAQATGAAFALNKNNENGLFMYQLQGKISVSFRDFSWRHLIGQVELRHQ